MCREDHEREHDAEIREMRDHIDCVELRCRELEDEKRKLQHNLNCAESELNRLKRGIVRLVASYGGEV